MVFISPSAYDARASMSFCLCLSPVHAYAAAHANMRLQTPIIPVGIGIARHTLMSRDPPPLFSLQTGPPDNATRRRKRSAGSAYSDDDSSGSQSQDSSGARDHRGLRLTRRTIRRKLNRRDDGDDDDDDDEPAGDVATEDEDEHPGVVPQRTDKKRDFSAAELASTVGSTRVGASSRRTRKKRRRSLIEAVLEDEDEEMSMSVSASASESERDAVADVSMASTTTSRRRSVSKRSTPASRPAVQRRRGDTWTDAGGIRYAIDERDGVQRKLVRVKERVPAYKMARDSKHPDASKMKRVDVERWVTDEEFEALKEARRLAWQSSDEEELQAGADESTERDEKPKLNRSLINARSFRSQRSMSSSTPGSPAPALSRSGTPSNSGRREISSLRGSNVATTGSPGLHALRRPGSVSALRCVAAVAAPPRRQGTPKKVAPIEDLIAKLRRDRGEPVTPASPARSASGMSVSGSATALASGQSTPVSVLVEEPGVIAASHATEVDSKTKQQPASASRSSSQAEPNAPTSSFNFGAPTQTAAIEFAPSTTTALAAAAAPPTQPAPFTFGSNAPAETTSPAPVPASSNDAVKSMPLAPSATAPAAAPSFQFGAPVPAAHSSSAAGVPPPAAPKTFSFGSTLAAPAPSPSPSKPAPAFSFSAAPVAPSNTNAAQQSSTTKPSPSPSTFQFGAPAPAGHATSSTATPAPFTFGGTAATTAAPAADAAAKPFSFNFGAGPSVGSGSGGFSFNVGKK